MLARLHASLASTINSHSHTRTRSARMSVEICVSRVAAFLATCTLRRRDAGARNTRRLLEPNAHTPIVADRCDLPVKMSF